MPLNFKCVQAELKGLNIRKEGREEEKEIAIDLKFEGETDGSILKALFGADEIPALWMDGRDRDPLYFGIGSISCSGDFDGHELKFARQHLREVRIHKIAVVPRPQRMTEIVFTASLKHPSQAVINAMSEHLSELGDLEVLGELDLFDSREEDKGLQPEQLQAINKGIQRVKESISEVPGLTLNVGESDDSESEAAAIDPDSSENTDPDYQDAVRYVINSGKASVAEVQRHLKISYHRAGQMIDQMQAEGIISHMGAGGKREVLVKPTDTAANG